MKVENCPFCGFPPRDTALVENDGGDKYYAVRCFKCCLEGPVRPSLDEAERAWNARPYENIKLVEALNSIATNTCCEGCQEAAKVAKSCLISCGIITDKLL